MKRLNLTGGWFFEDEGYLITRLTCTDRTYDIVRWENRDIDGLDHWEDDEENGEELYEQCHEEFDKEITAYAKKLKKEDLEGVSVVAPGYYLVGEEK